MNKVWFGFLVAGFINVIFAVISFSSVVWIQSDLFEVSSGLWQACFNGFCVSIPQDSLRDVDKAVEAFHILGFIASVGACIASALPLFVKGFEELVPLCFSFAGMFFVISMSLFTSFNTLVAGYSYGYSYILGWLACGFSVVLAVASGFFASKA